MYIERFNSGRISHYLKPVKTANGKYAIATANLHPDKFVCNINYPFFYNLQEAENYLAKNFEKLD